MDKAILTSIYEKIKTPYKYGGLIKFDDYYCDCPVVFRYEDRYFMTFVKMDKKCQTGYTTHLAESRDLLHWTVLGQILKGGNSWDAKQTGGFAEFFNADFYGDNRIEKVNGRYRFAYIGGNLSGYETDPLMMGYASSENLLDLDSYQKNPQPILRPDDPDARHGETLTLYKPMMFRDAKKTLGYPYVCAYNAKNTTMRESIFLAVSEDGETWKRYGDKAVISVFDCPDTYCINGDPQITVIDGHYVMFYFVLESGKGAYNTFAVSDDLVNWTKWDGEPILQREYEWENKDAHKPWVMCENGIVYHFYCAVNDKNERYIALAASKDLSAC